MYYGTIIGGTIGMVGGMTYAYCNGCASDDAQEDGGLGAPMACMMILPLELIAGGLVGALVGGGAGALVGRVVCERHDGGCVDEPREPERRPPPREPRRPPRRWPSSP